MTRPGFAGVRIGLPQAVAGLLYLSPAMTILLVFWILPLVLVLGFSFFHWNYGTSPTFAGLAEYREVLDTGQFWQSLGTTAIFSAAVVLVGSGLALVSALLLYRGLRAAGLFRMLFFLPYVTPIVATATVWLWMFQPTVGVIDRLMALVGLPGNIAWVNYPQLALLSVIVYTIWYSFGFMTLLFLAGLTDIPGTILEASAIDGAGAWHRFRDVIWPLLSPTTIFVLVISTVNAFQSFTQIYALTRGGPVQATTTLTYLIYETGFQYFHFGQASATAVLFFVIVAVLVLAQMRLARRTTYYQS